jgi:hypothetical protein
MTFILILRVKTNPSPEGVTLARADNKFAEGNSLKNIIFYTRPARVK